MAGNKELGEKIRRLREERKQVDPKYTLRQFAAAVGISPTYLSKIENGEFPAPADRIKTIAVLLETDPDELLALASKVDPELQDIIIEKPKAMAAFLRTASGMSDQQLERFRRYMQSEKDEGGE